MSPRALLPRSVRARLVVAVTLLCGAAFTLAAVGLVTAVDRALRSDLRVRTEVALMALGASSDRLEGPLPPGPGGSFFTVIVDGNVRAWTPGAPGLFFEPGGDVIAGADDEFATFSVPVPAGAGEGVLVAASPLAPIRASLAVLGQVLWVAIPVLTALIGAGAWVLTGRALRPVEAITARVEAITHSTLADRVPEPPTNDEVAHLARTMNAMLARLEEAAEAQRRFTGDASHELRTPLAALRVEVEATLAEGALADWPRTGNGVLRLTGHLERLVADLLRLARLESPAPPPRREVDLDDLVIAQAGLIPCEIDVSAVRPVKVHGSPDHLAAAVRNLLDNAAREADHRIRAVVTVSGAEAMVAVEDDGPGIPIADRDRVWDPFVRLDEARTRLDAGDTGAGLGLALVRRTAEVHGGRVAITDTDLGGARVELYLPVAPAFTP